MKLTDPFRGSVSCFPLNPEEITGFSGCISLVLIRLWVRTCCWQCCGVCRCVTPADACLCQSAHFSLKRWRHGNARHSGAKTIKNSSLIWIHDSRKAHRYQAIWGRAARSQSVRLFGCFYFFNFLTDVNFNSRAASWELLQSQKLNKSRNVEKLWGQIMTLHR